MSLPLTPNVQNPDGFYESRVEIQREMSDEAANRMNVRLTHILANHVDERGG